MGATYNDTLIIFKGPIALISVAGHVDLEFVLQVLGEASILADYETD